MVVVRRDDLCLLEEWGRVVELGSLARTLVALAVDDYTLDLRPDGVHFTMTKHAPVLELR